MNLAERTRCAADGAFTRPARHSAEIRAVHPEQPPARGHARGAEMAEAMREIFFRDGNVDEAALISAGFTTAEIIEHAPDARRLARLALVADGNRGDRVADFIGKATLAAVGFMPLCHATPDGEDKRAAWAGYCAAFAAHTLDPWLSQSERTLNRLKDFLGTQPLLPREQNAVVLAVAGVLRRARNRALDCRQ